jgi:hypothetical protein
MKKLLACWALLALSLTGCTLYLGDDDDDDYYCDSTGCYYCDDYGCYPDGPYYGCQNNYECAAGCYCDTSTGYGTCVEQGFCSSNTDCPTGYVCDDRSSCIPDGSNPGYCAYDYDCGPGSYCDELTGTCVGGQTCDQVACPTGYYCDDRAVCQPLGCVDDTACAPGCYCDETNGTCVETAYCDTDAECGMGSYCDEDRHTCLPGEDPNHGSCNAPITCAEPKPVCDEGSTPLIKDGCYTGLCEVIEVCDVPPPPPACSELTTKDACLARSDCDAAYTGVNCTDMNPDDGLDCSDAGSNCSCEYYVFAACTDVLAPPPGV